MSKSNPRAKAAAPAAAKKRPAKSRATEPAPAPGCAVADFPRTPEDWLAYDLPPKVAAALRRILAEPLRREILMGYLRKEGGRDELQEWTEKYDNGPAAAYGGRLTYNRKTGTRKAKNPNYGGDMVTTRAVDLPGLAPIKRHYYEIVKDKRRFIEEPVETPWIDEPAKVIDALIKQVLADMRDYRLDTPAPSPAPVQDAGPQAIDPQAAAGTMAAANRAEIDGARIERQAVDCISMADAWRAVFNLENTIRDDCKPDIDGMKKAYRRWAQYNHRLPAVVYRAGRKEYFRAVDLFQSMAAWRQSINPTKALKKAENSGFLTCPD